MMDLKQQTTTTLASSPEEAYRQIRTLADQSAIRDLQAMYSMAVDDHDLERVVDCFAADGSFSRVGATTTGHADLRTFYTTMMDRYVTTLHIPNSHVIAVDTDAGTGSGIATGQGELSLDGRLLMVAYRYDDEYVRIDDRWVFQRRDLTFMYNVPFEQMPTSFHDSRRIRLPGAPYAEADWPERLPTWGSYKS
jgi:ketosteroid isomerase-like protein